MKHINLLPPLKQKHALNLYFFLFAKFILILLLVAAVLTGAVLGGASFLLNESIQQVTLHSEAIDKEFTAVNKEILAVNTNLKQIEFVTAAKKIWSARIFTILQYIIPPSVSLSGLSVLNDGTAISMQGNAQTRNALLDLQSQLKKIDFVEDASIPLDNLIRENNIEFQINLKLKH